MSKGYQNGLFFISPTLFSLSSHFPTRQSFASLQHCLLSVAFQSTHQILFWHIWGLLSLQAQLLLFWVFTIFQSGTFPFSPFLFPLLLHQLVHEYRWLSLFAPSCQLKLSLVFLPSSRCHTEHWYSTTLSLLPFPLLLLERIHTIFPCALIRYKDLRKIPMDFLCYIVVSSLIFFLSHFLTSTYLMLHTFTFFPT